MHTTIAWGEAHTPDGTFLKLDAIPDQHIKVYGEKIYIGPYNNIVGGICLPGALALEGRMVSPSLRRVNPFYFSPLEAALVPTEPIAAIYHPQSPVKLDINEALEIEIKATAGAARESTAAVFLAPGGIPPVNGEIFCINCGVNVALVLHAWQYSEITFPDSLPVGNYRVVGARFICASGVVFRLVPIGEAYRPGGICAQAVDDVDPDLQRFGGLGNWFTFNTVQPPGVEVLGSAAVGATDYELYLDVIKQ